MTESEQILPLNPRVNFLMKNWKDLNNWEAIPLYIGFLTAPLFDQRSSDQVAVIVISIVVANSVWARYFKLWVQKRIGVMQPSLTCTPVPFRKRFVRITPVWLALIAIAFVFSYQHHGTHYYRGSGSIESTSGIWLCMAIVLCLNRIADTSNPLSRRCCNAAGGCALLIGFYNLGVTPGSFATALVLIGSVYLVLAIFDLVLLLRLASTPLSTMHEGSDA